MTISKAEMKKILALTDGYSCSDITAFATEVAMASIRNLTPDQLMKLQDSSNLKPVKFKDFVSAR